MSNLPVHLDSPNFPQAMSAEQVLAALDSEIRYEADSQKSSGWTKWAIWVALSGLIWVACELCFIDGLSFSRTAIIGLVAFFLRQALEEGFRAVLPNVRITAGPTRFRLAAHTTEALRPEMVFSCLQHLLLLVVLVHFNFWHTCLAWVYAIGALLMASGPLFLGRFARGVPSVANLRKFINIFTLSLIAYAALVAFQIAFFHYSDLRHLAKDEVRLALVLNAIVFLTAKLVEASYAEHRLNLLTQLRQHLAFARVSASEAKARAEEILSGVTFVELMRPMVEAIRSEKQKLKDTVQETDAELDKINSLLSADPPNPQEALRILDRLGSPPNKVTKQGHALLMECKLLVINMMMAAFYAPDTRAEVKAMGDSIGVELKEVGEKARECGCRYNLLKSEAWELAHHVNLNSDESAS